MSQTDASDIHGFVVRALDRAGYVPHGSDGSAWIHPTGTRVTTGYAGGQIRVRRFVPNSHRVGRIPPVTWDIAARPTEDEVLSFVGERRPAPELSEAEWAAVAEFDSADEAPESFRQQMIDALAYQMDALGMSPGRFYAAPLADAALAVVRGEK